ncbi:MAG: isomerase [Alphaproteobacteria bacterium RIFOXYD12_FULL_60_8]|nr:MAG: isomerase [Alphaproteobacteria bacterium RIFOXYD12_FULL_60_8]
MKLPIFQIDAFADGPFTGNPAAVVPMAEWLEEEKLQAIAAENNLSETAFFVGSQGSYALRWFTPNCEVDLCGHATLAAAHVILSTMEPGREEVTFRTLSGGLTVRREDDLYSMDFPALTGEDVEAPPGLAEILGVNPIELRMGKDLLALVDSVETVRRAAPDFARLSAEVEARGVILTAPGRKYDFVSRFFAPRAGIPEDPVTGSAHCMLAPFWAKRLGKTRFTARQLSLRGGTVWCEVKGDRVILKGHAVTYLEGVILV